MISVTVIDGVLRIMAEIPVPNAWHGQWPVRRIQNLMRTIEDQVSASDLGDGIAAKFEAERQAEDRCLRKMRESQ